MAGVTIENRNRGESNYTAKNSDHGLRESTKDDQESLSSGQRFRSSGIKKKLVGDKSLNSRKNSKQKT